MVGTGGDDQGLSEMVRDESLGVFRDRSLLKVSRIVAEDRIVGRDEQTSTLVTLLKPLLQGSCPPNVLAYGPSGTGKSLIANRVVDEYKGALDEKGLDLAVVEVNLQLLTSNFQACKEIARGVSSLDKVEEDITVTGFSANDALSRTFDVVDEHYDAAVVILDEIDLLVNPVKSNDEEPAYSALLYQLSRMGDITGFDDLSIIALTNSPEFMRRIDGRAESSFNPRPLRFDDYDANQLRQILRKREDAFLSDVLGSDVIPLSAALAAQDHGDARKAVDLLRTAGDLATNADAGQVTEEHVRKAQKEVEKDYIIDQAHGYNSSKKTLLLTIAACQTWSGRDLEAVPKPVVEDVYEFICDSVNEDSKSTATVSRHIKSLDTHGLIDSTFKSRGSNGGTHKLLHLNRSPEYIIEALVEREGRLDPVIEEQDLVGTKVDMVLEEFYDQL